jgi:nitrogen fixation/metabolism regulation signal transduction histidine kinase
MKSGLAKAKDLNPLENLGRATLQVVHDLKNQLNGLKLYATFLRKRLERDAQAVEERETAAKLIAGLDRAARDLTALVRCARPLELHRQKYDLRKIIAGLARVLGTRNSGDLAFADLACEIADRPFHCQLDPAALSEAFASITEEAIASIPKHDVNQISLRVGLNKKESEEANPSNVLVEWRGIGTVARHQTFASFQDQGTVHMALAAMIIEAHEGRLERDASAIRVWLPLVE